MFGLCGCGGVGFLCGVKWNFVNCKFGKLVYLICNVDEFELGMFKDW